MAAVHEHTVLKVAKTSCRAVDGEETGKASGLGGGVLTGALEWTVESV